mgnify:CR=1 FL=1
MSHSTELLTAAELATVIAVDCDAYVGPVKHTVAEWLVYRDEVLAWEDNRYFNYGGYTQVCAISDALTEVLGRRWWDTEGR